jgi:hypothetical protein
VHKGYSTAAHSAALNELGPCPEHRYSFINVRRLASQPGDDAGRFRPGEELGYLTQPGDDAGCFRPGEELGYLTQPGDDAGCFRPGEELGYLTQPGDDAGCFRPGEELGYLTQPGIQTVAECHFAEPGQHVEDGWGKMDQVNRPRDGEGRLSR